MLEWLSESRFWIFRLRVGGRVCSWGPPFGAWRKRRATGKLVFEILGSQNRYFNKKKFTRDEFCIRIVQNSPDRDLWKKFMMGMSTCRHQPGENDACYPRDLQAVFELVRRHRLDHSVQWTFYWGLWFQFDTRPTSQCWILVQLGYLIRGTRPQVHFVPSNLIYA